MHSLLHNAALQDSLTAVSFCDSQHFFSAFLAWIMASALCTGCLHEACHTHWMQKHKGTSLLHCNCCMQWCPAASWSVYAAVACIACTAHVHHTWHVSGQCMLLMTQQGINLKP